MELAELKKEDTESVDSGEFNDYQAHHDARKPEGEVCVGAEGAPDCGGVLVMDGNVCDECFKYVK